VALTRALTLGMVQPALAAVNVGVLVLYAAGGFVLAYLSLRARLIK
jgi:hypothetical protein